MRHQVAIVVDPNFGERLIQLAAELHVWAVDSPANRTAAERIRATPGAANSLERGITMFGAALGAAPERVVADILATVDLHHGVYSHTPAWSIVHVYGAPISPSLRLALRELGFSEAREFPEGFTAALGQESAG